MKFQKPERTFKNAFVERNGFSDFTVKCDSNIPEVKATIGTFSYKPHAELFAASSEMLEALKQCKAVADEFFAEIGNKRAANWGIINDGLIAIDRAIAKAEGKL